MGDLIFDQATHTYFAFDPIKHEYTEAGKRLPSVTEIVRDECGNPQYATQWQMDRGSKVHRAIALYLQGRLDESSLDERIKLRFDSAKKAIRELGLNGKSSNGLAKCLITELPLRHKIFQYAGTPDLLSDTTLVDWKSSHLAGTEIQEGGYIELLEHNGYKVKQCCEIVLTDDGYKTFWYTPSRSRRLFLAALTMFLWRQNGGK